MEESYLSPLDSILVGSSRTRSASSLVTDSAAGATALSCAKKTYNGAIAGKDSKLCLFEILLKILIELLLACKIFDLQASFDTEYGIYFNYFTILLHTPSTHHRAHHFI